MRVLLPGFLIALSLSGQDKFQAVKQALDLSDAQMARIQTHRDPLLSDAQRTRIVSLGKVLGGDAAKLEARLELINQKDWEQSFGSTCLFGTIREYSDYTTGDVPLSPAQAEQFWNIRFDAWQEFGAKRKQRDALLDSGASPDSPAVVELELAINKLEARTREPLSRDVVMSILDATQKARLSEFESELQIAAEAVELGLIERGGEILCH